MPPRYGCICNRTSLTYLYYLKAKPMTLQQLRYFLEAARHGSFSAAAEALHLAQPSLSEQIRSLEAELGISLFVRAGRGTLLTEAGRAFRPEAETVLAGVERARESVAEVREIRAGTLTFGTFGSSGWYRLADAVEAFRTRHPEVRLRAVGQNSSEVADAIRAGEVEAGLVVLPIDDRGLDVRPAIRDEIFYASRDPEHLRKRMSIRRLAEAPLILYDARWGAEDPTRRQLSERAQRAGVALDPVIEVEDVDLALDLAARGLGDTVISGAIAESPRFPGELATVAFSEPLYDTFAIASRRGAALSPATRAMIAIVEERVMVAP
jgi:DNA-binding transcriptional LysR family regulator